MFEFYFFNISCTNCINGSFRFGCWIISTIIISYTNLSLRKVNIVSASDNILKSLARIAHNTQFLHQLLDVGVMPRY